MSTLFSSNLLMGTIEKVSKFLKGALRKATNIFRNKPSRTSSIGERSKGSRHFLRSNSEKIPDRTLTPILTFLMIQWPNLSKFFVHAKALNGGSRVLTLKNVLQRKTKILNRFFIVS